MRIALVTESFYPAIDGTTTTVRNIVDRLVDTGHQVLVLAPGPGLSSYRGCRVVRMRPRDKPGRHLREQLAAFAPDVVHVASVGTLGRKALKAARRLDLPRLVVQQPDVPMAAAESWLRKVYGRADLTLVTCRSVQQTLGQLGVSDVPVWAPGVGTGEFGPELRDDWLHGHWSKRRSPGGARVVVGYVGGLHDRQVVRRLAEVSRVPGIRLVVIGDGPRRGWLEENALGAKFAGTLRGRDLGVALASLDVLVHPGENETCCHAVREAAASGVPAVVPWSGGAPDVVRDRSTGLLYDPTRPRAMRRAVATLVGNEVTRREMGAQARRHISERDWATAVDELVAVHYPRAIGVRMHVDVAA